jgi:hypothetical protein
MRLPRTGVRTEVDGVTQPLKTVPVRTRKPARHWPIVLAVVWTCATVAGMWLLWRYAFTAGVAADAPARWPGDALVKLSQRGPTLVMFAHPHCPCTRASMAELERILAKSPDDVTPWIVFYKPADADDSWEKTDLCRWAKAIPGARIAFDPDGAEAHRFGAATSGEVVVYSTDERLQFSGGITASRGHEGDNAGKSAVLDVLNHGDSGYQTTPVFGCSIGPATAQCQNPEASKSTMQ